MSSHHGPRTARLVVVGPASLRGQELILSGGDAVVGGPTTHLSAAALLGMEKRP
jgi:hypothetical protein